MSAFKNLDAIGPLAIWAGVVARAVEGRELTLAVVELEPKSLVAEHQHPNEQVGLVVKGELTFTVGGERRALVAGDTYTIPANVPHEALAGPAGAVAIDCFAPARADWKRFAPGPPSRATWPETPSRDRGSSAS